MELPVQKIARMVSGILTPPHSQEMVTGVSTDSRTIRPGELFVPLVGPHYNGHDYLGQAVQNGAAVCLSEEVVAGLPVPIIRVDDTLKALGDLAAGVRAHYKGPLVAITGTAGKTTTKEMLAAILSQTGPGLKTEGNFNNLIGLPLTLFRLEDSHRWVVLEMGMSARGEIARLAQIAAPTIGIITNVGPAHLQTLHGLEGVARAKGELFESLQPQATAVINADDERVVTLPVANGVHRLLFGLNPQADVRAEAVAAKGDKVVFDLVLPSGRWPVTLSVPGRHNVANALAAAAAAVAMKVDGDIIAKGLSLFRTIRGRMELFSLGNGALLIEDSYNANPASMRAALSALNDLQGNGRRIAVLGDMLELGDETDLLHQELGREAAGQVDDLLLLGEKAAKVAAGAREGGLDAAHLHILENVEAACGWLRAWLQPEDRLLIKGSRGMRMEKISAALLAPDFFQNQTER
ncbi:UDP-N-acetylmuramoyl-tripeptide--D-alanyl-D-alanine ligase [Desulfuromonas sp. AOP6]|uniref:UDP-N-acetylmuramoyl-tripeptide--D-alanyl-D- alanine ligase n=1 Tax=Desulfuromonas sp. AOP6 TaxID=1566351 RepID=UPI001287CDE8|nr:UDP-N-acetylmuramoyl-tripeptide--D-alanyl-D-alanine ligase [Desulfuromonas sp. AOP6]BCA80529.1 UDP-N-acetylmuramoyl-tripeptide--D-alanyl-D-alanine ligase [Desulfuromonas sp. AOP6]